MRGEVTAEQARRVFVQYSDDDGRDWTAPREITAQAKAANWRWYATGPGHALALSRGAHPGRLVVPGEPLDRPAGRLRRPRHRGQVLRRPRALQRRRRRDLADRLVDDNPDGYINVNETSAAELPDGRLYFNTREHNGTAAGNRADAYSSDGGQTSGPPYRPQDTLVGPVSRATSCRSPGRRRRCCSPAPPTPPPGRR